MNQRLVGGAGLSIPTPPALPPLDTSSIITAFGQLKRRTSAKFLRFNTKTSRVPRGEVPNSRVAPTLPRSDTVLLVKYFPAFRRIFFRVKQPKKNPEHEGSMIHRNIRMYSLNDFSSHHPRRPETSTSGVNQI